MPLSRGSPVAGEGLTCHGDLEVFQYMYRCCLNSSKLSTTKVSHYMVSSVYSVDITNYCSSYSRIVNTVKSGYQVHALIFFRETFC